MKQAFAYFLASALLCSGCATLQQGDPAATTTGAYIGGTLGNNIGGLIGGNNGGWRGSYRGSLIGTLVGTLAGAAVGSAITAQREKELPSDAYAPESRPVYPSGDNTSVPQASLPALRIHKIRFIDDNRNHRMDASESAKVIFEIMNEGDTPLYNVLPVVETAGKVKHLRISPSAMIEQIAPGMGIRYTATISTDRKWRGDAVTFRVAAALSQGKRNVVCDSHEFTISGVD